MIWQLKNLLQHSFDNTKEINGKWVPARPWKAPFTWRCRAAWLVLLGKADAVVWPGEQ